jgi:hypothetical protein
MCGFSSAAARRVRRKTARYRFPARTALLAFRAQIILALGGGLSNKAVTKRLATRAATVSKWRGHFVEHGLAGVVDAPRSGKPRHYDISHERRIIAALDASLPKATRGGTAPGWPSIWATCPRTRSGGCCARTRFRWRGGCAGASAPTRHSRKGRRPRGALPAAAGECRRAVGKAITGFNHEYKRHGTTTLFAALGVATGLVRAGHYRRRRRVEFPGFHEPRRRRLSPTARFVSLSTT